MTPEALAAMIREKAAQGAGRYMVALAGPPGAGKSTLSAQILSALGPGARVVPMDGFHYDDQVLKRRGLLGRKGAPETFDLAGFEHLLQRLRHEREVAIPVFDRSIELSRAGGDVVEAEDRILLVEGNYLLLQEPGWQALYAQFDLRLWLEVAEAELIARLQERWARHGKTKAAADLWISENDLPNIRRTIANSRKGDVTLSFATERGV